MVVDEVQLAPDLFPVLRVLSDRSDAPGQSLPHAPLAIGDFDARSVVYPGSRRCHLAERIEEVPLEAQLSDACSAVRCLRPDPHNSHLTRSKDYAAAHSDWIATACRRSPKAAPLASPS